MRKQCRVAAILEDSFSYENLRHECKLIMLNKDNWKSVLNKDVDMLLVESIWNDDLTFIKEEVMKYELNKDGIFRRCLRNNIPTVFWNKEDSLYYNHYINIAKHFNYIFTTDANCIKYYKKDTLKNEVYALSHGVQLKIYNPIGSNRERLNKLAFLGSWYEHFKERTEDMRIILDGAKNYNLQIFDRMLNIRDVNLKYPKEYIDYIREPIKYTNTSSVYKKFKLFININTIKDSPSMFSMRVFEILACGGVIISNYSLSMEVLLKHIVLICNNKEDVQLNIEKIYTDEKYRHKLSCLGQRIAVREHSYKKRFNEISKIVFGTKENHKEVCVLSYVNEYKDYYKIIETFNRQTYPYKKLFLVTDNRELLYNLNYNEELEVEIVEKEKNEIQWIYDIVKYIESEYITIFNGNNFYGKEYVSDMMDCISYTKSFAIGKNAYYKYDIDFEFVREYENEYVSEVLLEAALIHRKHFYELHIINRDNVYYIQKKEKLYANNRYNFLLNDRYINKEILEEIVT